VHGNAFDGTLIVRPAGFYLDPNFLGMYLVLASIAALALAFGGGRRALLWLLPAAPMLSVIAITYSRSSWVSLVVGVVMLVPLVPKKARLSLAGVLAVAVVLAVALVGPASLATRVTSVFELEPDSSSATRLLMTESTLEMIADRPVSGTGLEAFAEAYPSYAKPGARLDVTHPHQVPLALVAETGIAGLVVQIALLAATVAALRRVWRSGLSPVNAAVISGMAALLVGVFLQFFLYFEPLWLMTGLLAAAALDAGVDSHPAAGAA
jgi:O-antigen ligase